MTKIGSAFLPVSEPGTAAQWYSATFGLRIRSSDSHAAVLETETSSLTLLGPASGIAAIPGLTWAPFSLQTDDLPARRQQLVQDGNAVGPINGDDRTCLWFTATDPDGNTLLICDR